MSRRRLARAGAVGLLLWLAGCGPTGPPVVPGAPKYPDFPELTVPAGTGVAYETLSSQKEAWTYLQSGDLTSARRIYADLLRRTPTFFPAQTGLGFVALAGHDYKGAGATFAAVAGAHPQYLPALDGQAQAALGAGDDDTAAQALEAILAIDPNHEGTRARLDVVRFRQVEGWIATARTARSAGHLDDAEATLKKALAATPTSAVVLRELALTEMAQHQVEAAYGHAHAATEADAGDAEAWVVMGDILEQEKLYGDAAAAYGKAVAIDPKPAWRDRHDALLAKADEAAQPPEFRAIGTAASVTRGDVAAMVGLRLRDVLAKSPRHLMVVATDVRNSWASSWILQVIQAGVMDVFPDHTFQPAGVVRRADFAKVVASVLTLISTERPLDLGTWKAAQPKLADVPTSNLSYDAIALAVASGILPAEGDRFAPTRALSGAELVGAVKHLQQIATR